MKYDLNVTEFGASKKRESGGRKKRKKSKRVEGTTSLSRLLEVVEQNVRGLANTMTTKKKVGRLSTWPSGQLQKEKLRF